MCIPWEGVLSEMESHLWGIFAFLWMGYLSLMAITLISYIVRHNWERPITDLLRK